MPTKIQQRDYYKIFSGHNQNDGYEKIHLGYEASTTETILTKDQYTYFHYPYFSESHPLSASTLINNGATAGSIPAMADRIYKKLGGYGDNTPWGNATGLIDGTWLCSWLYSPAADVAPQWLDRYYSPGRIAYEEALMGLVDFGTYITYDSAFIDIPTTLMLESGVLYTYFHNGESTAQNIVSSFAGNDGSHLRLESKNWNISATDTSIYNNPISFPKYSKEFVTTPTDYTIYEPYGALNLSNTTFLDVRVGYNENLNIDNEFTLSFDVKNDDWANASSSQLVGNYTGEGGYGIYYDNLKFFSFFVIPETYFGHLLFFNQNGNAYNDTGTQSLPNIPSNPSQIAINGENELFLIDNTSIYSKVYKCNHLGNILNTYTLSSINQETSNWILSLSGNNVVVAGTTDQILYTFDNYLNLITTEPFNTQNSSDIQIAYDLDGNFVSISGCNDLKYDNIGQQWTVDTNGILYYDGTIFSTISAVQKIAIDPENNLWVLSEKNTVNKINVITKSIINTFEVGNLNEDTIIKRNISFINSYDRSTNSQKWVGLILHYSTTEKFLYRVSLLGDIIDVNQLESNINGLAFPDQITQKNKFSFNFDGDFTGYEWKRIFNTILYNNKPQLKFKIAVYQLNNVGDIGKTTTLRTYQVSVPVDSFLDKTWYAIVGTYKNNVMKLGINSFNNGTTNIPYNYTINPLKFNDIFFGTSNGKSSNFNYETNTTSIIFNGYLNRIRLYDYEIPEAFHIGFIKEYLIAEDLIWDIDTGNLQYIERIERFFKHKLSGAKSGFYNIKLSGLNITDPNARLLIEQNIKAAVALVQPAHTELLNIEWIEPNYNIDNEILELHNKLI